MRISNHASRLIAIIAIGLAATSVTAQPKNEFDVAIDNGDLSAAAKFIDNLAKQSASSTKSVSLDAYYGRFFAAMAQGAIAEPYLIRAISASKDRSARDALSFELARAREVDGWINRAEADYLKLSTPDTDIGVRQDAILSLARLRLGASPEEAIRLLAPLTDPNVAIAVRWESHLLLSRAYAILDRSAESKAALALAWQEASAAAVPATAISVTAMDMAIDRALANDRRGEIGLISIDDSLNRFAGVPQLPVCSSSLRPDDAVTIAVTSDAKQRPIYSAVRSSRPNIAHLFTVPIGVAKQRVFGSAFYVTVRCRSALDPRVRLIGSSLRTLPVWLAEEGQYPPLSPVDFNKGDPVTQLKAQVQALEGRAGAGSPVLAHALLQLAFAQVAQGAGGNAELFAGAKANADRAVSILEKAGAPIEVVEQTRLHMTMGFAQNQNIADVSGPTALRVFDAMATRTTTTPAQMNSVFDMMSGWQLRPTQRLALADRLVTFLKDRKVSGDDMVRQVAELRRAVILRELGTVAGMTTRLKESGLVDNLCSIADRGPSIPPAAITLTSEDYPKDLLRRNVTGLTGIELAVDESGKITQQRVIASQPTGLFDTIAKEKLRPVTLLPALRDDKPVACNGMVQTIRWQIPYQGEFSSQFNGFMTPEE